MTAHALATRSGLTAFLYLIDMGMRWHALTKAQRRVLCDPSTATNQPVTRLRELGYLGAPGVARTELGDALWRWAVQFKGVGQ